MEHILVQDTLSQMAAVPSLSGMPARLFVDGEPFLVRGAELHNSTATHVPGVSKGLESVVRLGANTALVPVNWAQFEPAEGVFDRELVTAIVEQARNAGLRVVLLWFGGYKNGASFYVPAWVRTDRGRFARCVDSNGKLMSTLSPFASETAEADAAAFRELMRTVEDIDRGHRTVIMVQVENETGVLGTPRDFSAAATKAWESPVDLAIIDLSANGGLARLPDFSGNATSWETAFGNSIHVQEAFMAAGMARYVETVAAAGRAETSLPFFTNTWLDSDIVIPGMDLSGGQIPGIYPSGGPLPHVAGIWRALAPSLDLLTPDIYFGDVTKICSDYLQSSGGLFVPEMRRDEHGAGDVMAIVGEHHAIGVAPFGVDSAEDSHIRHLKDVYELLAAVEPLLCSSLSTHGFHLQDDAPSMVHRFGDLLLKVERAAPFGETNEGTRAYGIVLQIGAHEFIAAGRGFNARFLAVAEHKDVEVLHMEEGTLVAGTWVSARRINGDEAAGGGTLLHPPLIPQRSETFPIPGVVEHTGISRTIVHVFG
ncbi:DUF5597 domain-containing protein [Arthrobacter sp. NtRootA1]|uniref:DUF5597 domain-containing protein n=1 Tax=Arthrobacter sp. NtRootA1 TaxID=2830983 RepID=UPI001CC6E21C|nr:DUF5597 domain-containing protein [Arthrobacter sp. NtRootA1]BCW05679.1 beta-galactosidase [Arthrobacter sp. NtRootA1]